MSNSKPRTWTELKKRHSRVTRSGSPGHSTSFRLIRDGSGVNPAELQLLDDPVIRSFENFQFLRKAFSNLCTLPLPMYADWIACCQAEISEDIIGNTPTENRENHEVATAFASFEEDYNAIMSDDSMNEHLQTHQVQLSLLHLLRTLLSQVPPHRLAMNILNKSIDS